MFNWSKTSWSLISKSEKLYSWGLGPCSDKFGSFSICEIPGKSVISSSALSMGWPSILPTFDLIDGGGEFL